MNSNCKSQVQHNIRTTATVYRHTPKKDPMVLQPYRGSVGLSYPGCGLTLVMQNALTKNPNVEKCYQKQQYAKIVRLLKGKMTL